MNNKYMFDDAYQNFVLLVFLFMMGMIIGWVIEIFYRHFKDKKGKWINPGFCVGPWLPVYGFGLTIVYLITWVEYILPQDNEVVNKILLFIVMSICMTIVELIAGIIMKKVFNMKLWDYSKEWLNYKGLICPKYSFFWMLLAAVYYFFIHYRIYSSLDWLSKNFAFSFIVGFLFAIFLVDVIYSGNIITKLKKYAKDEGIIYALEDAKDRIRRGKAISDAKVAFFLFPQRQELTKDVIKENQIK